MKFLLNIGNTHSEWCRQDLSGYQSIATLNLRSDFSVLDEMKQHDIFCASVVPELTRQLKDAGFKLAEIKADKLAVDFSQVDQSTLGADRIANVAAAYSLKELPAMVIDCGTAITTEIIDASAVFQGGAILPGRRLARQAMAHYTGQGWS